ncbi:MAG: hypothetical protein ACU84H_12920 [Gammaproteobacteria bacterium]
MNYRLTLYNAVDGELTLPLTGFTLRKRIDQNGDMETSGDMQVPAGYLDAIIAQETDELRLYEDAVMVWSADIISITSGDNQITLTAVSVEVLPMPASVEAYGQLADFIGSGYSRVRVPYNRAINPGDTIMTDRIELVASKVTARFSLREQISEIADNATG